MTLIPPEPFRAIDSIFSRMMPSLFGRRRFPFNDELQRGDDWLPSTDISETDKEYLIRAELPAVKKEDVHVRVEDGLITIEGERKQQMEEKKERFHRIESYYGSFSRSFSLPENVDANAIRCEAKEGVLTVRIPKKTIATAKPKEITVEW